ncbi:hypothetical protein L0Z31_09415 [Burkholderia vietnamiensis]|uniref:hypothetical protein n=1 Tax=Burkholderia vietnamiensis TaxID=60552 RepID=UPI0012D91562|nr:hypothetical protein [Burkholderia vietnamiensis]MCO1351628.1 hypothetical protein [Burkholderia vietnamiensis]MCO1430180.1 hypothetical protein [Burkholderia vietnamiensis]UQN50986.1 hypothetical protein L0Y95_29200 [Burkholderia vietnamiensis]HDR9036968.1 hypothetical protein [Burkholderia vietnamiensis]HDR9071022.1 hypothetical protein [Burkholderia vietnamiensis]
MSTIIAEILRYGGRVPDRRGAELSDGCFSGPRHSVPNLRGDYLTARMVYSTAMVLDKLSKGLFERWLEIEAAAGKPLKQTLDEINAACGTAYRHNWPAKMAEAGYALERIPLAVRRHMMRTVLPAELSARGVTLAPQIVEQLIKALT